MPNTITRTQMFVALYCLKRDIFDQYLGAVSTRLTFDGNKQPGNWVHVENGTLVITSSVPSFNDNWTEISNTGSTTVASDVSITGEEIIRHIANASGEVFDGSKTHVKIGSLMIPDADNNVPPITVVIYRNVEYTDGTNVWSQVVPHGKIVLNGSNQHVFSNGVDEVNLSLFPTTSGAKEGCISTLTFGDIVVDGDSVYGNNIDAVSLTQFELFVHLPASPSLEDVAKYQTSQYGSLPGHKISLNYSGGSVPLTADVQGSGYTLIYAIDTVAIEVTDGAYAHEYPHVSTYIKLTGYSPVPLIQGRSYVPHVTLYDTDSFGRLNSISQPYQWLEFNLSASTALVSARRKLITILDSTSVDTRLVNLPYVDVSYGGSEIATLKTVRSFIKSGDKAYQYSNNEWVELSTSGTEKELTSQGYNSVLSDVALQANVGSVRFSSLNSAFTNLATCSRLVRIPITVEAIYEIDTVKFTVATYIFVYFNVAHGVLSFYDFMYNVRSGSLKVSSLSFKARLPLYQSEDLDSSKDFHENSPNWLGYQINGSIDSIPCVFQASAEASATTSPANLVLSYSLLSPVTVQTTGIKPCVASFENDSCNNTASTIAQTIGNIVIPGGTPSYTLSDPYNIDSDLVSSIPVP